MSNEPFFARTVIQLIILPSEYILIMPDQELPVRLFVRRQGQMVQCPAMERIIRPAVGEFLLEPAAYLDLVFRRDRDIASIEQAVEIAPQQEAVLYGMRAVLGERLDVGGFESGQGMFRGNGAGTFVSVRYQNPECPLA